MNQDFSQDLHGDPRVICVQQAVKSKSATYHPRGSKDRNEKKVLGPKITFYRVFKGGATAVNRSLVTCEERYV